MWLSEITLQSIVFRVLALPILAVVHGIALAGTAVLLGDKGPRYDGRLGIAPNRHIDLLGAIGLVIFSQGWGKPVDVDASRFRIGRPGSLVVVLAGFLGLLLTAAVLDVLTIPALTLLPGTAGLTVAAFLRSTIDLAIWFALLGLIPVPPLAGGIVAEAFGLRLPRQARMLLALAVLAAVAAGLVRTLLGPAHRLLLSVFLAA